MLVFKVIGKAAGLCRTAALLAVAAAMSGCAGNAGPEMMTINAAQYDAAFGAAIDAARAQGMAAGLRDRRAGVIETEPAIASSLLEPWHADNASFDQAVENTIAFQRRRARFEFVPAGSASAAPASAASNQPGGVLELSSAVPSPDLTQHQGPIELRVSVVVERSYEPGIRHNVWSRRAMTVSRIVADDLADQLPSQYWTPVERDEAMERRLLAAVDAALHSAQ